MNYAVIDVGSNTIRLCVYDVSPDKKRFKTIVNRKSMVGLYSFVSQDILSDEGVDVAIRTISKYLKRAAYFNPCRCDVFATAVIRNIKNSVDVRTRIEASLHIPLHILSADDEAHLGFVGATSEDKLKNGVLLDIGGGSAELVHIIDGVDCKRASLSEGSLSAYRKFVSDIVPTEEEFVRMRASIRELLLNDVHGLSAVHSPLLFGIGGSIRALGEVAFELGISSHIRDLEQDQLQCLADTFFNKRRAFLDALLHIAPDRVHTICCGMAILLELFNDFDAEHVHVCKNGIREGYLLERMLQA